jgi:hypothetical protein
LRGPHTARLTAGAETPRDVGLAAKRDGLDRLRAPDPPVRAAVGQQDHQALRCTRLVKNLDVDAAAATITDDIAVLERAEQDRHNARACSCGNCWHGRAVAHGESMAKAARVLSVSLLFLLTLFPSDLSPSDLYA